MKHRIINLGAPFILRLEEEGSGTIAIEGKILKINPTAVEIINCLESGQSVDEISSTLSSSYSIAAEEVQQDIIELLNELNLYAPLTKPELVQLLND